MKSPAGQFEVVIDGACSSRRKLRVAIGSMVYNEAPNLGALLETLSELRPRNCDITQIVIVSSGSTDASNAIALAWAKREPRAQVLVEPERRGKAKAINSYLDLVANGTDICLLVSADLIPARDAVEEILTPFDDATVGMSGGRPCPTNALDTLMHRIVHCQWDLHHLVASLRPKLGELVAFRNRIARVDPDTAVDEASIEAMLTRAGLRLAYAGRAVVYNRGPSTLGQFLAQRRRIYAGHLWLKRSTGYQVATLRPATVMRATWQYLRRDPRRLGILLCAACLESLSRCLGLFDLLARGRNPTAWRALDTTKAPVVPAGADDRV